MTWKDLSVFVDLSAYQRSKGHIAPRIHVWLIEVADSNQQQQQPSPKQQQEQQQQSQTRTTKTNKQNINKY